MHFADLLRRSSTRDAKTTPYHGQSSVASSSQPSSKPFHRPPRSPRRTQSTADSDDPLLYPTGQAQAGTSSNRASRYSATDNHSIGEAPSHPQSSAAPSSKGISAVLSRAPSLSSLRRSSKDIAPSSITTTISPSPSRAISSAIVSPRPTSIPVAPLSSSSTSPALHQTRYQLTDTVAQEAPLSTPLYSTTLLRRKSTKTRSIFPPASSSTGTSSTLRDRSHFGNSIFRRPSLGRGTGSVDSSTLSGKKALPQNSASVQLTQLKETSNNMATSTRAPAAAAVDAHPSITAAAMSASNSTSSSGGRLSRFFGRRKSFSGPINVTIKPDLVANPVPVLPASTRSPPLAVISDDRKGAAETVKSAAQSTAHEVTSKATAASVGSTLSAFSFPSVSSNSSQQDLAARRPSNSRQTKHSNTRSVPVASLPISSPIPLSASQAPAKDDAATLTSQRRPSHPVRRLSQSFSERRRSKSFSMIGSLFGFNSQTDAASPAPPLPEAAASLSQLYPAAERRPSEPKDSTSLNHSRRPSLAARLGMGRETERRPSTPEIESWRQIADESAVDDDAEADMTRMSRASIDNLIRPKASEAIVRITRSRSTVRRKPAPEVKQEEIDSSSSTPVYGKVYCTLDVDQLGGSPRGGSPASSYRALAATQSGSDVEPETDQEVLADAGSTAPPKKTHIVRTQSDPGHTVGLGLIGAPIAALGRENASIPGIDVHAITPPQSASPKATTDETQFAHQELAPTSSPSVGVARLSPSMQSMAASSERPWSLISASETDTPVLKLRKLVVDTHASDNEHDKDRSEDGRFFRSIAGTTNADASEKTEVMSEAGSEQLESSSQTTTQSDTKHEMASIHSSGSSTIRAVRTLTAQPSSSGLSAASGALSDASQASPIRVRQVTASLSQVFEQTSASGERDADSVGPLPSRSLQHHLEGSTGSTFSQMTLQQARRASTASRTTARSSGRWSDSRFSEDALSALEAEVGQARRAEVVALGRGRVRDWVGGGGAQRVLPTAEAPTLSRSNTLPKKVQHATAPSSEPRVDDREAQRQQRLTDQLSRRLQQLSDAQDADNAVSRQPSADDGRDDVTVEDARSASTGKPQDAPAAMVLDSTSGVASRTTLSLSTRSARLSAFHDRKAMTVREQPASRSTASAAAPSMQVAEEAIRLGHAPSKRVRRNVSDTRSIDEAVVVKRKPVSSARRNAGDVIAASSSDTALLSLEQAASAADPMQASMSPSQSFAPLLSALNLTTHVDAASPSPSELAVPAPRAAVKGANSELASKQRSYATSEEAARAKQYELLSRERRLAEKESRRQAQMQDKYAKKKQSDPLLAARLALAGLQPTEAVPQLKTTEASKAAPVPASSSTASLFDAKLLRPAVPERRASSKSRARLTVAAESMTRTNSNAGSVASFHTAQDATVDAGRSPLSGVTQPSNLVTSSGQDRPDTSGSVGSSPAADFDFPAPPQRMKEQLSDDGTVLGRARLQDSPAQQGWRERRHYLPGASSGVSTPMRDSSLRHRPATLSRSSSRVSGLFPNDDDQGIPASTTMPELGLESLQDSVKQPMALRRSRSTESSSRDLRKLAREQMLQEVSMHPSPKSAAQRLPRGLGIELADDLDGAKRYSNASGKVTPSTMVGAPLRPIAA